MNKKEDITDGLNARLRSTGVQSARLYGLARVLKKHTPIWPVFSL